MMRQGIEQAGLVGVETSGAGFWAVAGVSTAGSAISTTGDYTYNSLKPHAVKRISLTQANAGAISSSTATVSYNILNRPETISDSGYTLTLSYGADEQRQKTVFKQGTTILKTKYFINDRFEYEKIGNNTRMFSSIYADGRLVAIAQKINGGTDSLFYVFTDHLGSYDYIVDQNKVRRDSLNFDSWGNRRNYTLPFLSDETNHLFERGFTGHEHLDQFKIINMNARLYDPIIGRFFSPDPYVQLPDNTQSYNRYSYCLNKPMKYTDPEGEIFGTIFGAISDFVNNIFVRTFQGKEWDWTQTKLGWEIDKGLFHTDPNKSTGGRIWEFVSRLTWQLPQTLIGDLFVSGANAFGSVNDVSHGYGITAIDMGLDNEAVTIGFYTAGPKGYKADWSDHLFVHEYGHYIQSQRWGPLYLLAIGLPSIQSAVQQTNTSNPKVPLHENRWFEAGASRNAANYFDKHYGSGKEGYIAGSEYFFDKNSFATRSNSPYLNHRTGAQNSSVNPISGRFHWTDIWIYVPFLGFIPFYY